MLWCDTQYSTIIKRATICRINLLILIWFICQICMHECINEALSHAIEFDVWLFLFSFVARKIWFAKQRWIICLLRFKSCMYFFFITSACLCKWNYHSWFITWPRYILDVIDSIAEVKCNDYYYSTNLVECALENCIYLN